MDPTNDPSADQYAVPRRLAGFFAAALSAWWGHLPVMMQILFVTMGADTLIGVFRAASEHRLDKDKAFKSFCKKAVVIIAVGLAAYLEKTVGAKLMIGDAVSGVFVAFYGSSLLQNLAAMGLPVPAMLAAYFAQMEDNKKAKEQQQQKQVGPIPKGIDLDAVNPAMLPAPLGLPDSEIAAALAPAPADIPRRTAEDTPL